MQSRKAKRNNSGLKLAVVYSLTPNRLGFCGPQNKEHKILYAFLVDGKKEKEVRKILEKFEGAYAYYTLIAKKNSIKDALSRKVIEAYWVGNNLLEKISSEDIKEMVREKFISPLLLSRKEGERRIKKIPVFAKPHHSFHVLILGTVTGTIDLNSARLKDICRVGWGKVIDIKKEEVEVEYRPLVQKGKKIVFGRKKTKKLNWDKNIIPTLGIGNWISFHWDSAVQILNKENIKNLEKYTQLSLKFSKSSALGEKWFLGVKLRHEENRICQ